MYRKIKADQIFTGNHFAGHKKVLVIKNDGTIEGIVDEDDGGDIEIYNGIICPGFINAHCHLELSHMKGIIPEKTGLTEFVFQVVNNRHPGGTDGFTQEEMEMALEKAENEMLLNGIVAVGDICNNLSTLPLKQKQRLAWYNFIEVSGWLPAISKARFERALDLFNEFSALHFTRQTSIVPHAPYSVSADLWQLITPWFSDKVVSIHNQETIFEDEFFREGTGGFVKMFEKMGIDNTHHRPSKKSSLQTYFSNLAGAASIIIVHNTFIKQEDIDFVKRDPAVNKPPVFFCICINANRYIENALPPVELLSKNDCNIVLGTDSLASNWGLNILDEMKTIQKNFITIPLQQMLGWATLNGAMALLMDKTLGSFEKGKKPGVLLIDNIEGGKLSPASAVRRII